MRALLVAAALLAATPAFAQPLQRLRGTIVSLTGDTLVLQDSQGASQSVKFDQDTAVRADAPATLDAIKPGMKLAIVSRGSPEKQTAVGLRAMAPGISLRDAILPWDLLPESTMTNASVEGQQVATEGQVMTLKSGDKTVQMTVPANATIAVEDKGDRGMLVAGAHVTVFAAPGSSDGPIGRTVIVGLKGLVPPV